MGCVCIAVSEGGKAEVPGQRANSVPMRTDRHGHVSVLTPTTPGSLLAFIEDFQLVRLPGILFGPTRLKIVPGAVHLFSESGTPEQLPRLAAIGSEPT
jgi:hypothetical protein